MSMPDVQVFEFLTLENAMHAIESFSKEGFEVSIKPMYRMNVGTGKAELDKYNLYVGKNNRLTTECLYNMEHSKKEK